LGVAPYPETLESPDPGQRIAAIAKAADAGNHEAVPLLVDRLTDEDEAVRFYAILALERIEGTRLGYDYAKNDMGRSQAVKRWRRYVRTGRHLSAGSRKGGNESTVGGDGGNRASGEEGGESKAKESL